MANGVSRRSHALRTSRAANRHGLGVCERALKPHLVSERPLGEKPRRKPDSGKPTVRDCRGARGNVTLSRMTQCARLGSIPTLRSHFPNKIAILAFQDPSYELPEGCWSRDPDGFPGISGWWLVRSFEKSADCTQICTPSRWFSNHRFTQHGLRPLAPALLGEMMMASGFCASRSSIMRICSSVFATLGPV